jgi:hypothetical protein
MDLQFGGSGISARLDAATASARSIEGLSDYLKDEPS